MKNRRGKNYFYYLCSMYILARKKEKYDILFKRYFSEHNEQIDLLPLIYLVRSFRAEADFSVVVDFLEQNREIAQHFSQYLKNIFSDKVFCHSLTEANILSENTFFLELKKRIINTVLPAVAEPNTVWYVVDNVFVNIHADFRYFKNIPKPIIKNFFEILEIDDIITNQSVKTDLMYSLNVLAWRVIGNAMEVDVLRMVPEYQKLENPFIALQNELDTLIVEYKKNLSLELHSKDELYKQINIYLKQCLEFVNKAFKNSAKYGISGKTNQSLLKIQQQLHRMKDILSLMVIDHQEDIVNNSIRLVTNILEYKTHKNNLIEFVDDSTRLLSHLITNHTAETGTHYITYGFKAYINMFWKASGGGIIVGVMCMLKMLYSYTSGSEFSHAVLYSMNYAVGFIVIYLMHYTLATKQPAMTAATMAKALSSENNTESNYLSFASVVSKLFRTQFIAFVGNVLWAFPISLAVVYIAELVFGQNFAIAKADKFLKELNPFESKAILHACLAGFYLFISGIMAGNVANSSVFYKIPTRIAENPQINMLFGKRFAQSLSEFYSKNWAGIVSNFWFGIFLGATAPIGHFLGVDLDIRHITFSAGNFALGLYGKGFDVSASVFWISFITIFIIGFFNFIVSFGLSMLLALRSRKVTLTEFSKISKVIYKYFWRNPLRFFIPIRSQHDENAKEFMEKSIK